MFLKVLRGESVLDPSHIRFVLSCYMIHLWLSFCLALRGFPFWKKKSTPKCSNDIIDRKTVTVTLDFEVIWELRDSPKCFPYNYFHKRYSLNLVTNSFFQWFSNPLQLCTAIGWSSRSSQPHVLTGGSSQRFAVLNLLLAGNTCSKQSVIICCSLKAPEIPYPCSQDGLQPLEALLNIA